MPDGLILMTPTSVATSGAGASASIGANGSVTFTTCLTLSINGVFTSAYDNYVVMMRFVMNSGSGDSLTYRLRASGSDNSTASSYKSQYKYADNTSVLANTATDTQGYLGYSYQGKREGLAWYVFAPYKSEPTASLTHTFNDRSDAAIYDYGSTHSQSTAYDGFTLLTSTNRTLVGLLTVFGFNQ